MTLASFARLGTALAAALLAGGTPAAELRPVEIQADEMVVRARDGTAVFTGRVRVRREGYLLTCRRLTVKYDDAQRVRSLVADGNVRVTRGSRVVTSERAELDNAREVLTLTGDPVLHEGPNVVRGTSVIFDLPSDEVRVTQVEARVEIEDVLPGEKR